MAIRQTPPAPKTPAATPEQLYASCKAKLQKAVGENNPAGLDHDTNNSIRFNTDAFRRYTADTEAMQLDRQWTEMKAAQLAAKLGCLAPRTVGTADILTGTGHSDYKVVVMSPGGHLALIPFNPDPNARGNYLTDKSLLVVHADDLVRSREDEAFLRRHARTMDSWQDAHSTLRLELATEAQRTYGIEKMKEQGLPVPRLGDLPPRPVPAWPQLAPRSDAQRLEPPIRPLQRHPPEGPAQVSGRTPVEPGPVDTSKTPSPSGKEPRSVRADSSLKPATAKQSRADGVPKPSKDLEGSRPQMDVSATPEAPDLTRSLAVAKRIGELKWDLQGLSPDNKLLATQRDADPILKNPTHYNEFRADPEAMDLSKRWTTLACERRAEHAVGVQNESGPAFTTPQEGVLYKIIAAGPGGHLGLRPVTAAGAPILDAPCLVVHRDALEAGQKPALAMSDKQLVKGIDKTKAGITLINLASEEQARHNASRQTKSEVVSQRGKNEPER